MDAEILKWTTIVLGLAFITCCYYLRLKTVRNPVKIVQAEPPTQHLNVLRFPTSKSLIKFSTAGDDELLVIDSEGRVFLEGKHVGTSKRLAETLATPL